MKLIDFKKGVSVVLRSSLISTFNSSYVLRHFILYFHTDNHKNKIQRVSAREGSTLTHQIFSLIRQYFLFLIPTRIPSTKHFTTAAEDFKFEPNNFLISLKVDNFLKYYVCSQLLTSAYMRHKHVEPRLTEKFFILFLFEYNFCFGLCLETIRWRKFMVFYSKRSFNYFSSMVERKLIRC